MNTRRLAALAALILVATLAAYSPLRNAGFIWDDDDYVTENQTLRSLDGLRRIWVEPGATHQYYPLVHSSFWLEYRLWGLNPLGYHLVNVLLHAANALLLWLVLRRLRVPGAALAAAIFALHPVHVESVAWVTERKNVLSGLFYLLALWVWLRSGPVAEEGERRGGPLAYALLLLMFLCALSSKTVTASLPAVMLLLLWWKRPPLRLRELLPIVPLFAMGVAASLVTIWMERTVVGAQGEAWELSFIERCLIAGRALWFYAGKLIRPVELTFIYPRWEIDASSVFQLLFPVAALLTLLLLWFLLRRRARGPLVAVLVFAGTLVPALGFIDVYPMRYSFVADHFQYLASVGLIALFAAGLASILGDGRTAFAGRAGAVVSIAILVVLASLTWQRSHAYRDAETLWRDTIAGNPASWMAHTNLGNILARRGEAEAAMSHYDQALLHEPGHVEAHNNRGLLLARQGRLEDAAYHFGRAILADPDFAESYNNMATALVARGELDEAIGYYADAVRLDPTYADAHFNWGKTLVRKRQLDLAAVQFQKATQLRPNDYLAYRELAQVLEQQGLVRQAIGQYREAIHLSPDWQARNNLAWILATQPDDALRDGPQAVELAEQACRQTGFSQPGPLDTLAAALAEAGRFEEAARTIQQAIELASGVPGQEVAVERYRLRQALYAQGRPYREGNRK